MSFIGVEMLIIKSSSLFNFLSLLRRPFIRGRWWLSGTYYYPSPNDTVVLFYFVICLLVIWELSAIWKE